MTALLAGLGAALAWSAATLASSPASRRSGAPATTAWVMVVGLVVATPVVLAEGVPRGLDAADLGWLAASGAGNVLGLALVYAGLRRGRTGPVSAVASTEGALTAVLAVAAGETLRATLGVAIAVVAVGVVITAAAANPEGEPVAATRGRGLLPAGGAAVAFACGLYAAGHVSHLPLAWVALSAPLVGTVAVVVPLALAGRMAVPRPVLPLVVLAGVCEVVGLAFFALGARDSVAVTAVIASQVPAFAALGAYPLLGERLTRTQAAGIAVTAVGVALTAALTG